MTRHEINLEILAGTLFVVSHSGGKDSQAMYLYMTRELKIPHWQIKVVHAQLPGADWEGSEEHIEQTIRPEHQVIYCQGVRSFDDMVRRRNKQRPTDPSFPSSQYRQCTSDLKRDPINKVIRQLAAEGGYKRIINCMGIRAAESVGRSRMTPWKVNARLTNDTREVFDWYPIFEWSTPSVFNYIEICGQEPFWAYGEGMTRKSCMFCIMACKSDIRISARLNPGAFAKMVQLEKDTNSTMFSGKTLEEVAGITVDELINTNLNKVA